MLEVQFDGRTGAVNTFRFSGQEYNYKSPNIEAI